MQKVRLKATVENKDSIAHVLSAGATESIHLDGEKEAQG